MSVPSRADGVLLDLARQARPCGVEAVLAPAGGVLVLAPHPDDETLGCGGAIMAALAAGRDVTVALLTDGEASHPRSSRFPSDRLASLRRAEFEGALDELRAGAGARGRLRAEAFALPDTRLGEAWAADGSVLDRLVALAAASDACTLWSTWRHDPHCDHAAAAALADRLRDTMAEEGVMRADYAVWGRFGAAGRAARLDDLRALAPVRVTAKCRAMDCYRSQLTMLIDDDPSGFVMPAALCEHFADSAEIFIRGTVS